MPAMPAHVAAGPLPWSIIMPMSFMVSVGRSRSGRHFGAHASTGRKRRHAHAGAIDALSDEGVGAVLGHDDQVVSLGIADLQLVDLDRPDIDPVCRDDQSFAGRGYAH